MEKQLSFALKNFSSGKLNSPSLSEKHLFSKINKQQLSSTKQVLKKSPISVVSQQKQLRQSVSQVLPNMEKELKVKTLSLEKEPQPKRTSEINTTNENSIKKQNPKKEKLFENLISVKTVAEMLGLAPKTIHNWVYLRKIPYVKCGQKVMFRTKSLEAWLNRKEIKPWL